MREQLHTFSRRKLAVTCLLTGVGLVLVVVVLVVRFPTIVNGHGDVFWLCEDCGVEFFGDPAIGPIDCVACAGEEAVRLIKYECLEHKGEIFGAYLVKPDPESYAAYLQKTEELKAQREAGGEGSVPIPPPMLGADMYVSLYRFPDGEWTKKYPKKVCCPEGNCDRKKLKYHRPGGGEKKTWWPWILRWGKPALNTVLYILLGIMILIAIIKIGLRIRGKGDYRV